jgi:3-deoxy-D-manno-octulosonic-acid transferase
MNNFRDITAAFVSEEAIIQIPSERDLLPAVERCIRDSAYAAELGRRARQVIDRQRGATTKTLTYLEPCMSARS